MILIFGTNFKLWNAYPIVQLKSTNGHSTLEIKPPQVIYWSDTLLECQLPGI
jgi:hypothetical protein